MTEIEMRRLELALSATREQDLSAEQISRFILLFAKRYMSMSHTDVSNFLASHGLPEVLSHNS
jgi:hypothetical protein